MCKGLFNVDILANYLHHLNKRITPIKLQKGLYFLFAYYGAFHCSDDREGICEGYQEEAKYLFEAEFEAWQYGPVIPDVYSKFKNKSYGDDAAVKFAIEEVGKHPEVKLFIDELFEQINSVSDFNLVDRSHDDLVWKNAYEKGSSTVMGNEEIVSEYKQKGFI